jgi:hypothetical protein
MDAPGEARARISPKLEAMSKHRPTARQPASIFGKTRRTPVSPKPIVPNERSRTRRPPARAPHKPG